MNAFDAPLGTVVVGVDGSPASDLAVDVALVRARLTHRPLTLVHALSPMGTVWLAPVGMSPSMGTGVGLEALEVQATELLAEVRTDVSARAPELEVHDFLGFGDPRQVLLDAATRASVLVLGSRGRGPVRSLLLGSVAAAVSHHVTCPLVVVRPPDGADRSGVLVAVDGTERSAAPLEFAFQHASMHALPLTVLHAYWDVRHAAAHALDDQEGIHSDEDELLLLAEMTAGMSEKYPDVVVRRALATGTADVAILDAAAHSELVVLGTHHGSTAAEIFYGSVATTVMEHAACPVAVVPISLKD
jgi:nucleotide-binding universal stress UspA family protein